MSESDARDMQFIAHANASVNSKRKAHEPREHGPHDNALEHPSEDGLAQTPDAETGASETKRRRYSPDTTPADAPLRAPSPSTSGSKDTTERPPAPAPPDQSGKANQKPARGNWSRRDRRGTRNEDAMSADIGGPSRARADKPPRLPKRPCAVLIGYCGTGYSGMQIQQHARTIEGVLFDAMVQAGAVSQDNADNSKKVALSRAARTDAGVHAAGNVISLKMIPVVPGVPDLVARINEELPPSIRMWGFSRVQRSFNARTSCETRKYTYFFPTYALIPPKPSSQQHKVLSRRLEPSPDTAVVPPLGDQSFWADADAASAPPDDLHRKRQFRLSGAYLARLRDVAKMYEGTHNWHNFTWGREFREASCKRYMKRIEISDPQVYGDTEWVSVLFHGQSFMLHQIRKMMAALVLSCRVGSPPGIFNELYGPRKFLIPKMPALGLLLEQPQFESYNTRMAELNDGVDPSHVDYRPVIDWDVHRDAMEKFKLDFIYKDMRDIEDQRGLFDSWIRFVDNYGGDDLLWLDPYGRIPDAAVIKKGERRAVPFREKARFNITGTADLVQLPGVEAMDEVSDEEPTHIDKKQLEEMEG